MLHPYMGSSQFLLLLFWILGFEDANLLETSYTPRIWMQRSLIGGHRIQSRFVSTPLVLSRLQPLTASPSEEPDTTFPLGRVQPLSGGEDYNKMLTDIKDGQVVAVKFFAPWLVRYTFLFSLSLSFSSHLS